MSFTAFTINFNWDLILEGLTMNLFANSVNSTSGIGLQSNFKVDLTANSMEGLFVRWFEGPAFDLLSKDYPVS